MHDLNQSDLKTISDRTLSEYQKRSERHENWAAKGRTFSSDQDLLYTQIGFGTVWRPAFPGVTIDLSLKYDDPNLSIQENAWT